MDLHDQRGGVHCITDADSPERMIYSVILVEKMRKITKKW